MSTLALLMGHLVARTDAQLCQLLVRRPELMDPPVPDFAALAARASSQACFASALDLLNLPQLQVFTALLHLWEQTPDSAGLDAASIAGTLQGATPLAVADILAELNELALVLVTSSPSPETCDAGPPLFLPVASAGDAVGAPSQQAGRPGDVNSGFAAAPPIIKPAAVAISLRDNASLSAMAAVLRVLTSLLEDVNRAPLTSLRSGGVSKRAVSALSSALAIDIAQVYFYLELAAMAKLISRAPDVSTVVGPHWVATAADWLALGRTEQWAFLIKSWLLSCRLPALIGAGTPAITALSPEVAQPGSAALRRSCLQTLAAVSHQGGGNICAPTHHQVAEYFAWSHPRLLERASPLLPGFLTEAELLGVTGAGALTEGGAAVVEGRWDDALSLLETALPAAVDHFLLQGDLTAVAPGYLLPELAAELALMADPEGAGMAAVYRFSAASLHRALAAGHCAEGILDFLTSHASTPVPQGLRYLVHDCARVTAGATSARQSFKDQPPRTRAQRAAGQTAAPGPGVVPPADSLEHLAQWQVQLLRGAPVMTPGQGESAPALVRETLLHAIRLNSEVWLEAVDGSGHPERHRLLPLSVLEGRLRAREMGSGAETTFGMARVMDVELILSLATVSRATVSQEGAP